jgi:hypothetical protein
MECVCLHPLLFLLRRYGLAFTLSRGNRSTFLGGSSTFLGRNWGSFFASFFFAYGDQAFARNELFLYSHDQKIFLV